MNLLQLFVENLGLHQPDTLLPLLLNKLSLGLAIFFMVLFFEKISKQEQDFDFAKQVADHQTQQINNSSEQ